MINYLSLPIAAQKLISDIKNASDAELIIAHFESAIIYDDGDVTIGCLTGISAGGNRTIAFMLSVGDDTKCIRRAERVRQ